MTTQETELFENIKRVLTAIPEELVNKTDICDNLYKTNHECVVLYNASRNVECVIAATMDNATMIEYNPESLMHEQIVKLIEGMAPTLILLSCDMLDYVEQLREAHYTTIKILVYNDAEIARVKKVSGVEYFKVTDIEETLQIEGMMQIYLIEKALGYLYGVETDRETSAKWLYSGIKSSGLSVFDGVQRLTSTFKGFELESEYVARGKFKRELLDNIVKSRRDNYIAGYYTKDDVCHATKIYYMCDYRNRFVKQLTAQDGDNIVLYNAYRVANNTLYDVVIMTTQPDLFDEPDAKKVGDHHAVYRSGLTTQEVAKYITHISLE